MASQTLINQRYRLEAELGSGGMGTVHRAFDTTLEREVAVKLVTGYELETEGRARLLQEAKSIAQLNHPHIVTVYDAGEMDQAPYIVMELIEGTSLHAQPPRELGELVQIAGQICQALEHAHQRGIVHRDLKPENVLIEADGNAKLMDFGIARSMASRLTQEGQIEGTVFYMAPELALGKEYDGRADLYALGVMMYELTTGELPFQHGDPVAVISQHVHAPVVRPRAKDPQIPGGLDQLIVQLMAKDPDERPANAGQVLRMLGDPKLLDAQAADEQQLSTLDRIVRGRMIGREAEFERARELWYAAAQGDSQILLVSGEPGVGKTRLLREIITQSEVMGAQVLGSASYAEGGPPYSPFKQILREVLPKASQNGFNLPEPVVADLLSLAPEFRAQFPEIAPNPPDDPQSEQHRLFESFFVFLAALSHHSPLLVYLDDAHWADSGSLGMFRHVARQLRNQPILLLATYREIELDEARPLQEVLLDLSREPQTTRIKLNRLNLDQTRELLASFFQDEITPEFLEGIYRETDGNPFFIEEVCKALVESGKLYFEDGRWHRPEMSELGIPQSVRVAIQSRVGKLSPETQEILSQAAVLGREFAFDTLIAATEVDEEAVIDALEQAERAQLIEERSDGGDPIFSFSHALIPSTLIEGMRILQRRRLHRRAAQAIQEHDPENHAALGIHFLEAGDTERGVDHLLKAGDQANAMYAHREAIASYLQALDYAKETEDNARAARTLMKLGLAYHNSFQYPESRKAYEEGFIYWQRAGEGRAQSVPATAARNLRVGADPPTTLDPGRAADFQSAIYIGQLFSPLVQLTPELGIVPDVARSWHLSDGGKKYRFELRDDVHWSDGQPVTAADFEFAWKRLLHPGLRSGSTDLMLDIKGAAQVISGSASIAEVGVQAVDDHTLLVELERPIGYFLQMLARTPFSPVPQHIAQADERWAEPARIVTNGPFVLDRFEEQHGLSLRRNPSYHGKSAGNAPGLDFTFHQRGDERPIQLYEQDQIDILLMYLLSSEDWDRARNAHPSEYIIGPALAIIYLAFDVSRAPFDDVRVRKAFCQSIDLEALAEISQRGFFAPATGGLVPPGIPGHTPDAGVRFDPERAAQLLEDAGYPGGQGFPEIECLDSGGGRGREIREHLAVEWRDRLGVDIHWRLLGWGDYLKRLRTELPNLWGMGWAADYPDPDNFLRVSMSLPLGNWGNRTYAELVERGRVSIEQAERVDLYEQAQLILSEEVPVLPLVYWRTHLLVKPWISQFPWGSVGNYDWKDVVIEPHD